jgi:16S rRNA (cytidine1402-2'-O)-methyltransferase
VQTEKPVVTRKQPSQRTTDNSSAANPSGAARDEQAQAGRLTPGLYPVATPIGNLRDITLRALDILTAADLIVCEDTRVTRKLLTRYAITTKSTSYNDHNAQRVLPGLIRRLKDGESLALVSDAGTPLISDPGFRLVEAAIAADIPVYPVPGANAALAGLLASGLPTDSFFFAGFLPPRQGARRNRLAELAHIPGSLVFYESPGRLAASLTDMHTVLGDRAASVAREITKLHEEVQRGSLVYLAETYANRGAPRGEIVVVVGPPEVREASDADVQAALLESLKTMSVRDAAAAISKDFGRPRRAVYAMALELARGESGD